MIWFLLLQACAPEGGGPPSRATNSTVPELPIPDISGADTEAVWEEALTHLLAVTSSVAFDAHDRVLAEAEPGCPDLYLGPIDDENFDAGGRSWVDYCTTDAGLSYRGSAHWTGGVSRDGDDQTAKGAVTDCERSLEAGLAVRETDDSVRLEIRGDIDESLSTLEGPDYGQWTWSSRVDATVTGAVAFGPESPTPAGWRADVQVRASGGNADTLEVAGDVYLFGTRFGGRFDSIDADLALTGPRGAGPDDCLDEPRGTLSIRDGDAIWYDLVFLPRFSDDLEGDPWPNDPLSICDGCGTLYVRGVVQGTVCPDLMGFVGQAEPPEVADFVSTLQSP